MKPEHIQELRQWFFNHFGGHAAVSDIDQIQVNEVSAQSDDTYIVQISSNYDLPVIIASVKCHLELTKNSLFIDDLTLHIKLIRENRIPMMVPPELLYGVPNQMEETLTNAEYWANSLQALLNNFIQLSIVAGTPVVNDDIAGVYALLAYLAFLRDYTNEQLHITK